MLKRTSRELSSSGPGWGHGISEEAGDSVVRVVQLPDLRFFLNSINFGTRLDAPKFVVDDFRGRESTYLEEYIVPV